MRSQGTEFIGDRGYLQASEEEGGERPGLIFPSALRRLFGVLAILLDTQFRVCIAWRKAAQAHPRFAGLRQRAALLVGEFPGCLIPGSGDLECQLFIRIVWECQ